MILEVATHADANAISEVAETTFKATFAHLYPPEDLATFLENWMPPHKVAAQIADPDWMLRVIRNESGDIIGYIKLGPVDFDLPEGQEAEDAIELHQLYLLPAAHGSGAAADMMDWAMTEARARGAKRLFLSVYIDNLRAQRFYVRYGFYEVGKNPFHVGNIVDDDRIWRCDL